MARSEVRTWRIVALTLLAGVLFTAQRVMMAVAGGRHPNLTFDVFQEMLYWGVWAVLCPLVLALARRLPLHGPTSIRSVLAHLGASLVLAPIQAFVAFRLHQLIVLALTTDPLIRQRAEMAQTVLIVWGAFMGVFWYWIVVALYTTLRLQRLYAAEQVAAAEQAERSAALEAQVTHAQLEALRSQLHPHFLFNALNTIAVLTAEQGDKARQTVLRLASLLRRSLDEEHDEVALEQELSFLEDYLDIQRVRFGDRLSVRFDIESGAREAQVPVLLLLPLFENVIKHATWGRDDTTTIVLRVHRVGNILQISVEDSGPGPRPVLPAKEGVGLGNTRQRLERLYGERASLNISPSGNGNDRSGVRVDIQLPFVTGGT